MIAKTGLKLIGKKSLQDISMRDTPVDLTFRLMGNSYAQETQMVGCGFGIGEQRRITE